MNKKAPLPARNATHSVAGGRQAFTLIELLVVIAIIGILATVSIVALNNARAKSRDAKRVADIKNIQTALALYYNDKKEYPITLTAGQPLFSTSLDGAGNVVTSTYMSVIPSAPTPADGSNCNTTNNAFTYVTSSDLQYYTLSTCLNNNQNNNANTLYIADPNQNQPCGSYLVDYLGQVYQTVQVGTQCWLASNLNVGTMVNAQASAPCVQYVSPWWSCQIDNNTVEKYCYNNDPANCATYGGLYEWPEAMGFAYQCANASFPSSCTTATTYSVATKHQGICPSGWHIPNNSDWSVLETYLTNTGNTCNGSRNGSWDCSPAGAKLKTTGSSGFNALFSGKKGTDGSTSGAGSWSYFWSSTVFQTTKAYQRYLSSASVLVASHSDGGYRAYGFSVRCLKD